MASVPHRLGLLLGVVGIIGLVLLGAGIPATIADSVSQQAEPETDNTVTRITLSEDGSARWTVQIRTRLQTDQNVREYETFQTQFRNETSRYLGPFSDRIRGVVANAANATGREMRATNFTASTRIQEVPRRWGIVTYEFTWTNFAAETGDALVVGDVFQGGFFIAANDTLQIEAPSGYTVREAAPEPDESEAGLVSWTGREDFADGRPRVVLSPAPNNSVTDDQPATTESVAAAEGTDLVIGAGIVALTLLGLGAALVYRRRADDGTSSRDGTTEVEGTEGAPQAPDQSESSDPQAAPGAGSLKTDEEQVLDLLAANGGRMRQQEIAEAFDWSDSKTSRLVSSMTEEGTVEKLRIGRENLVALAEDR